MPLLPIVLQVGIVWGVNCFFFLYPRINLCIAGPKFVAGKLSMKKKTCSGTLKGGGVASRGFCDDESSTNDIFLTTHNPVMREVKVHLLN